jgi:hypothetical protein
MNFNIFMIHTFGKYPDAKKKIREEKTAFKKIHFLTFPVGF